jgi:PAS domain S-box-containing protein
MSPPLRKPRTSPKGASTRRPATQAQVDGEATMQALVHELRVHQVELEQQNEELRRAQDDLAAARDRFIDLFDFAPVGYLTLDGSGLIAEANLTAAAQLGVARQSMLGRQFMAFVGAADGDRWQRLKALALRRGDLRRIELALRRQDGEAFHAQLDCVRVAAPSAGSQLRVALTDISERRLAETNRRIANSSNDARESERWRVAYELHEDLGQRLSAIKLRLGSLGSSAEAATTASIIGPMTEALDQALAMVLRMSSELHPLMLHNLGLIPALESLAHDATLRLGVAVTLQADENEPPLADATAMAVYRLAEMVLAQLARHAHRGISIELLRRPRDVVLELRGDTEQIRGTAPARVDADPMQPVKDQIHLLGGRLEINDKPQDFRSVTICLPLVASA